MSLIEDSYTYDEIMEAAGQVFDRLLEAGLLDRTEKIDEMSDAYERWMMARIRARHP